MAETATLDDLKAAQKKLLEQKRKLDAMARRAGRSSYDEHRERVAEYDREESRAGREIGPLPKVLDPDRRELCRDDLELFGITYFPHRFKLPMATFHKRGVRILEEDTQRGGLSVVAWPRGSGKDTWAEVDVLHAILYGWRRFVGLIGPTEPHAKRSLKKIKRELEGNKLLAEDFPEVCYPIKRLERINHRARGQTLNGEHTLMDWTDDWLTLPTVAGSPSSGATIYVSGITGAIRGPSILGPSGEPLRPDKIIVNDVQTRESAKSPTMTAEREAIVSDDILMLAGPDVDIAVTMLCTVIYTNDLSSRYLSPDKHPEWRKLRTRMLETFPTNAAKWDEYAEIRRDGMREGDKGKKGSAFYEANRLEMDKGAVVSWPERKKKSELSGIQSAMNLFIDNRRGFFAEAQNEPEDSEALRNAKHLTPDGVAGRLNGAEQYTIPPLHTRLTAFIDLGQLCHWFAVIAWTEKFGGAVIDYGAWPRQNRAFFAADDARPSLVSQFSGHPQITTEDQRIYAGLEGLTAEILGKSYFLVGGGEQHVEICLVDSGHWTKTVYQFVQRYAGHFGCQLHPSKGIGRTTTARGVSEWKPRPGERKGYHWRLTSGDYGRTRAVQFDPDAWKSVIYSSLNAAAGGAMGLWLFGKSAGRHEMIANHCAAEIAEPVTVRGSTFDKWEILPHKPDNHLFDCLVGGAVAASVLGLQWSATADGAIEAPATKARTLAEMQAEAKRNRSPQRR